MIYYVFVIVGLQAKGETFTLWASEQCLRIEGREHGVSEISSGRKPIEWTGTAYRQEVAESRT